MKRLNYGYLVIICCALLTVLGLLGIYASSSLKGAQQVGDEFYFLKKQLAALGVGVLIFAFIQRLSLATLKKCTLPVLCFCVFLLLLIFVPGAYVKILGAKRWLNLPFIGGQPAELTKIALVLFLARNLSRQNNDITSFKSGIMPNIMVLGIMMPLLLLQKDLGTPVLLLSVTGLMLFVAGVARKLMISAVIVALGVGVLSIVMEPYRVQRVLSFVDPWASARGAGFQIIQSFLAFRNGGFFGAGLGESRQKLFFLPEAHSDFILAVLAEELGILGVLAICLIFLYLTIIGLEIANRQTDPFCRFLAFGLTVTIAVQALMNMGVAMGLLPTKGIPLPFISSGNSSLLVFLCMASILARIGRETTTVEKQTSASPRLADASRH